MGMMDLKEILRALGLEALRYKGLCAFAFIAISSAILSMGYVWPETYATSAMLHVDEQNIIEPLLGNTAAVTKVDRTNEAREIIYNRQFLEEVITNSGSYPEEVASGSFGEIVKMLRTDISIEKMGREYFRVSFISEDPERTYQTLNATVNLFINYTNKKKKEESFSAYSFIDSQVQSYKKQLEDAEDKLKNFKATNTDGTEAEVTRRIGERRAELESLELQRSETQSKIAVLNKQISSESSFLQTRSRLTESLRLTYQDNYPDIVSIKAQIEEIDRSVEEIYLSEGVNVSGQQSDDSNNPLYEELRIQLSEAKVALRAQAKRIDSLNKLLAKDLNRAEKVAQNQATLSDLTRDYNVTRGVYEDMLERKEKARLSMVLDIEGQGVSYQVHEPSAYPNVSIGLQFTHFAIIAPLLGLLIPLGALVAYIILDPRLRSASFIRNSFDPDDFLVEIPYSYTTLSKRLLRRDALFLLVSLGLFLLIYGGFVANKVYEGGLGALLGIPFNIGI